MTFATLITILTIEINDNLWYLTINCDTGQHSQFLRCFIGQIGRWFFLLARLRDGGQDQIQLGDCGRDQIQSGDGCRDQCFNLIQPA